MCTKNISYNLGSHIKGDDVFLLRSNDCMFLAYEGRYLGRNMLPLNTKTRLCYTDCLMLLWPRFLLYLISLRFAVVEIIFKKCNFYGLSSRNAKTTGWISEKFYIPGSYKRSRGAGSFFFLREREAIPLCIIKFVQYIMYRQYTTYIKTGCNNYN